MCVLGVLFLCDDNRWPIAGWKKKVFVQSVIQYDIKYVAQDAQRRKRKK